MAKPRVLLTSFWLQPGDEVDRRLQEAGCETVYNRWHGDRTEEEMIEILKGIDGAIVSIDPFTPKVLAAAPQLKVVARTGVGYDAVNVPAATEKGVAVCITPGANNRAVADFAFTLLLASARRLLENLTVVPQGGWKRYQGKDLPGSTIGIVGLGSIGKEVAKRARGFDMRVLAYDVFKDEAFATQHQVTYVPLDQLLRESDFVTLHCFLDDSTRHLIDAERLALMKPTAYLINTARGPIVDEEALYQALKEKKIAGAALDVFDQEPLPAGSPLRGLDNVYLAPHVAGQTDGAIQAMGTIAADNVIAVLRGEKPLGLVNREVVLKR
ncbi:MAG: phosphoglycerate dehydrogenase [Actinobacteria bacterium]|nr:phosphoglycerate dehydrogenase [Actinomycetota bacterium]